MVRKRILIIRHADANFQASNRIGLECLMHRAHAVVATITAAHAQRIANAAGWKLNIIVHQNTLFRIESKLVGQLFNHDAAVIHFGVRLYQKNRAALALD